MPRVGFRHHLCIMMVTLCMAATAADCCAAMISVGSLEKATALEKYGITMHARPNGDAGVKVWLEFKKQGWLAKVSYVEQQVTGEEGKHVLSAMLMPNPVHHRQAPDVTTVAFSADPGQLERCRFLVVCHGSIEGDVGYTLAARDFVDLESAPPEE